MELKKTPKEILKESHLAVNKQGDIFLYVENTFASFLILDNYAIIELDKILDDNLKAKEGESMCFEIQKIYKVEHMSYLHFDSGFDRFKIAIDWYEKKKIIKDGGYELVWDRNKENIYKIEIPDNKYHIEEHESWVSVILYGKFPTKEGKKKFGIRASEVLLKDGMLEDEYDDWKKEKLPILKEKINGYFYDAIKNGRWTASGETHIIDMDKLEDIEFIVVDQ